MLRAGALGGPGGIGWGGRWEGGSVWGTCVYPWLIRVNVWQNHHNIVISLQFKIYKVKYKIQKRKKRIRLPMLGTQVRSLLQEDSTCLRAAKPTHHCLAGVLEPMSGNFGSPCTQNLCSTTKEATATRMRTLQLEMAPAPRS